MANVDRSCFRSSCLVSIAIVGLVLLTVRPAAALMAIVAPLPAFSVTPVELPFDAPGGGTLTLSIVGKNLRGQRLAFPLVHVADVTFEPGGPLVFYRSFRLGGTSVDGILTDSGFVGSVTVEEPVVRTRGIAGLPDADFVPELTTFPLDEALRPGDLEALSELLGRESLTLDPTPGNGSPGFDFVVPEPGPALLVGLGLALLSVPRAGRKVSPGSSHASAPSGSFG